jgi:hypothetical protein
MNTKVTLFLILIFCALVAPTHAESPSAEGAYVYIISPANGETVTSPVLVKFGLRGMGIAPAGVEHEYAGHHHLLVDVDPELLPPLDKPLPADDQHIQYGKGQTEAYVDLKPGTHTLQLMLADHNHMPHKPPLLSAHIMVNVVK